MAREPVLPTLRAATFAALCLALGAGAHEALMTGPIPAWALLIGAFGAFVPARYAAGRGEHGLLGISALMGAAQVVLHLLFCYAQDAGAAGGSAAIAPMPMPMPAGVSMSAGMSMPAGMSMSAMGASVAAGSGRASAAMLLAHALAALVCAWWLRRGEAALHAVIRRAVLRLRVTWAVAALVAPPVDRVPRSPRSPSRILRSVWLRGVAAQRGPPPIVAQL